MQYSKGARPENVRFLHVPWASPSSIMADFNENDKMFYLECNTRYKIEVSQWFKYVIPPKDVKRKELVK